ncbi:proline iminopeptidase-family hydrolase [Bifidobacterium aquikefiri]
MVEGTIPFKGYATWYLRVGHNTAGKLPLLVLHGGPGAKHNYLRSLDGIAERYHREVIYYDQLGCGNSATPFLPELWGTDLWEEEIDVVREALGLERLHILGQSWGGMLLMQYAINRQPIGVKSMVVASSPASIPLWESEALRLMDWLPKGMKKTLVDAIATGNFDTPEYAAAAAEYNKRHVLSMDDPPEYVVQTTQDKTDVYRYMQGEDEFMVTGKLKGWDISNDLWKISIPTLLTSGVMDEATPLIVKQCLDRIPHSEWKLFIGTHMVHVERKEAYNRAVEAFLEQHE